MDLFMKDILKRIKQTYMANLSMQMEIFTKEDG